ncbi:hypothetical protein ABEX92_16780 [Bacillus safensis subsp. osmophilus]
MNFESLNINNSTIVFFEGVEYRTTQNPYVNDEGTQYEATAINRDNEQVLIEWEITYQDYKNLEDESDACDWDNPSKVIRL